MGYNIYEEDVAQKVPQRRTSLSGSAAELEEIYVAHSGPDGLAAGIPFKNACLTLSQKFPDKLMQLKSPAMEGRAFSLFDVTGKGMLLLEDFVNGVTELLNPKTPAGEALSNRLASGQLMRSMSMNYKDNVKTVCVMGAGVAGLQVANLLQQAGKKVVIFEKSGNVGGVWRENYADFGLQVPKELYEFPGFPYPKSVKWNKFPTGPEVQKYIEMYADEFKLRELIRFKTPIVGVSARGGEQGWEVKFKPEGGNAVKTEVYDYLVVATGMYGWPPHMPVAPGSKSFKGEILHSCTFQDRKVAAGKHVVVVGGGKSAVDNAVAAGKEGKSSTLIYRDTHWPVPRYLANLVPFKWGTYSRFGHSTLEVSHTEPACYDWLHHCCTPLKWVWWRVVETMFSCQFNIPSKEKPKTPIEVDLFTGGQILTYEYRNMLKQGKVKGILGAIREFKEKSVVLQDGTELEADMVIYGTGFKKNYDFIERLVQEQFQIERDGLWLYRNILPVGVPNMAFIGCEVSTFNNILTHGLQAKWLAQLLSGVMDKPAKGTMMKTIEKEQAWKRSWMPPSSARAAIWQLHMLKYHDNLCKDMGVPYKRKSFCLPEVFAPYTAADYKDLFGF